jgi:hypothetical protein
MPPSHRLEGVDGLTLVWLLGQDEGSPGALWTPSTSDWRNDGGGSSCSLGEVLETSTVPTRYYLSSTACSGILRRAAKRGKKLPEPLAAALQAGAAAQEQEQMRPAPDTSKP